MSGPPSRSRSRNGRNFRTIAQHSATGTIRHERAVRRDRFGQM
jgi:hypothetical protein